MLDYNNIYFKSLVDSYKRTNIIVAAITILVIVIVSAIIIIYKKKNKEETVLFSFFSPYIIALSIMFLLFSSHPYCKAFVKVNTEKISEENITETDIKNSDYFIKRDGDIYFVTTLKRSLVDIDKEFVNKEKLKEKINESFNRACAKVWMNRKISN